VKTIEDMNLIEPYKKETYKMMLEQILGKSMINKENIQNIPPINKESIKKIKKDRIGRGKKSKIFIRIEKLLTIDFFNTEKTMRNIQEKLREQGYNFDLTKISPVLLGLIRSQKLKRTKNEKKRFVYSKINILKDEKNNNHAGPKAEEPIPNLSGEEPKDNSEIATEEDK